MKRISGESEKDQEQEQKVVKQKEEIARKIKAGVEEEDFYRIGFERQKRLLKRIKFEEGESIRKLIRNIMEKYGDEGFQLLKYIEFEGVDEKGLVEVIRELECIPIIRECNKVIRRLIEAKDKNEIEIIIDWESQYREEAKQRQTIEAELKVIKSKYEGILSILQKTAPHEKEHSKTETKRIFEMFKKKDLKSLTKSLSKDSSLIFVKNKYGDTLLHKGVEYEWIEGMEVVMEYGFGIEGFIDRINNEGETALIEASEKGKVEVVKFLVSKGADIEIKGNDGMTAMMWASYKGYLDIVQFLVSKGANIEEKDNYGRTGLILASSESHLKVVQFLISEGADIEVKGNDGMTALALPSYNGSLEIVQFLVSKGANIETKTDDGYTPLIIASGAGHLEIVEFLISKGANIEAKDNNGWTSLMFASLNGKLDVAKFLISKGANIEAKDNEGATVLMYSSKIAEFLTSKGAKE